jgi:glycosyltransferase involved in cell wall biosynthesis
MTNSTVDIIIPCHNTGRYLRQAIDSALAQTYPHINVLVVDDGSTDNTGEIVESYGARVRVFEGLAYRTPDQQGLRDWVVEVHA